MARKKTTKSRTRQPKPGPESIGPRTTEDLSDDVLQALAFKHQGKFAALDNRKTTLALEIKNAKALAKAEMGADALEVIDDLKKLETEGGETRLTMAVRRILRSARWVGSKLGKQFEFFDGPDRTPAVDRAFEEGKRAGMKCEARKPPYDSTTEQFAKWMEGYTAGNTAAASEMFRGDAPKGSAPKEERIDEEEPASGERVSRSEFKERLAAQSAGVHSTIIAPVGDQPSTAHITRQ